MEIGLSLDMKIVHNLGHDNYQLKCMCGEEFTYIKSRVNWKVINDESVAKCPKCKATWTGDIAQGNPEPEFKIHFYAIMAIFKDEKQAKLNNANDNKALPIAVGTGINYQHFILTTFGKMRDEQLEKFELIQIQEIDQDTFEKLSLAMHYRSVLASFSGLIKTVSISTDLGESHGKPEG